MPLNVLPENHPVLQGAMNPPVMAIGDSLYNGVRSLSITAELARQSVPAQVAAALGVAGFRVPNYPRPVLFDLEDWVRNGGLSLASFQQGMVANAQAWINSGPEWSYDLLHDNLAIAGAEYANLWTDTAAALKAQVPAALATLQSGTGLSYDGVGKLYYGINGAFVLNPSGHHDLDDLTPLEWVASRKPQRLLISIGSNNGLFRAGISGIYDRACQQTMAAIPDAAAQLVDEMVKTGYVPPRIYMTKLIKPSTICNLMPREDYTEVPDGKQYFDQYLARLGGGIAFISGDQMAAFDAAVADLNAKVEAAMRAELAKLGGDIPVLTMVDVYGMSEKLDAKHLPRQPSMPVKVQTRRGLTQTLSNIPLSIGLFGGFDHGGLFGLDNMHPTVPAYALFANTVLDAIEKGEPGVAFTRRDVQAAFQADSLLQNPPGNWDFVAVLAALLGSLGVL